jgi:cobalamin biosynthetic protein CobC
MAAELARRGGLLVVDEAFGDVTPELSVVRFVGPGLLVLRSFGKFFGLAGLRLGFAVADPVTARLLRTVLGPWSVSGPAMVVGRAALADKTWIAETRQRLTYESTLLDNILIQAGLSVLGGTSLFRLVNAPRAWALYEHLGQRGILVRPFAAAPRWLRFGLPPGDAGRKRLREALVAWNSGSE